MFAEFAAQLDTAVPDPGRAIGSVTNLSPKRSFVSAPLLVAT